jgi:hypothetical protein
MHDTIARRMDLARDAGVAPQPATRDHETAKASNADDSHSRDGARLPRFGSRGPSRSWVPGVWGDPF